MVYIICMLVGILTAFVGSLVGLGGGVILIPILLYLHQMQADFAWATPQAIVGISLVVMVFTALSSTISYHRMGRVDYRTGVLFLVGSIPGGIIGSWLNQYIKVSHFSLYFGFMVIIISLLFLIKRKPRNVKKTGKWPERVYHIEGKTYYYSVNVWIAFLLSLIVGILSGLFGIGGGSIMVPAMILLFGFPAHIATATSMFMILFISLISASTHIVLGHVDWNYVIFFIPAAWVGGKLGVRLNRHLHGKTLEWILRIVLMFIGVRLIIDGLT